MEESLLLEKLRALLGKSGRASCSCGCAFIENRYLDVRTHYTFDIGMHDHDNYAGYRAFLEQYSTFTILVTRYRMLWEGYGTGDFTLHLDVPEQSQLVGDARRDAVAYLESEFDSDFQEELASYYDNRGYLPKARLLPPEIEPIFLATSVVLRFPELYFDGLASIKINLYFAISKLLNVRYLIAFISLIALGYVAAWRLTVFIQSYNERHGAKVEKGRDTFLFLALLATIYAIPTLIVT